MRDVGIDEGHMHNAGNDAAYTMTTCLSHEISRLQEQQWLKPSDEWDLAGSTTEALKAKGEAILLACPLDPYRCDNCGMRNHSTDDCHKMKTCDACHKVGHPRAHCRWSTWEKCKQFGHTKEKCQHRRAQQVRTAKQGHSRDATPATKTVKQGHNSKISTDLADTSSFPTLGAAVTASTTIQTVSAALDTSKVTVTATATKLQSSPKNQGRPAKKGRKRFQDFSFSA